MRKNQAFVLFAQCNLKRYATVQRIKKIAGEILDLQTALNEVEVKRQDADRKVQEAQKAIHTAELDLKALDAQEVEKKRRVLNTNNAKEYESLIKEIGNIAEKKPVLEDSIFRLWENLENAKNNLETVVRETQGEISRMANEIAQKKSEQEITEKNLDDIETEFDEYSKLVDKELLELFKYMFESIPNPAVPIDRGSCSGCFSAVPSIDLGRAERGDIVRCKDCFRLLYVVNAA